MIDATLGIDVGTTAVKAAIIGADGTMLGQADRSYPVHHPRPGLAEQDPEHWWAAIRHVVHAALTQAGPEVRVLAVGAAGQGCGLVAVDEDLHHLRPAIIWMDTRSAPQCDWMRSNVGEAVNRANGAAIAPFNVEPKILWMREFEPDLYRRTRWYVTPTAWITMRLCGEPVANHSDAGLLFAYDLRATAWSREVLDGLDVPVERYPRLAYGDEVVGTITAEAAADLGLPGDVLVVGGAGDTPAAALASGVTQVGDAYLGMGTASVIGICHDTPVFQPKLLTHPYVLEGQVFTSGSTSSFGASLRWAYRLFNGGDETDEGYAELMEQAAQSTAGSQGLVYLPYLSGELHPILDPYARGTFIGLSQSTTRSDMLRAVMEGGAFSIRDNLAAAAEVGLQPRLIHAAGGLSRSPLWTQIIADVTGLPVHLSDDGISGAAVGAALLAARGAGIASATGSGGGDVVVRQPDEKVRELYDSLFGIYRSSYEHLKSDFRALHALTSPSDA